MICFLDSQVRLPALALVISCLLTVPPLAAAQSIDRPCSEEAAPRDGFESPGVGLTTRELEALYGEGEIGQGSIFYDFKGFDLHKLGCDLLLAFPLDGIKDGQSMDEFALAEALLPADAKYAGSFARGSTIRSEQSATLWRSASLAERFAQIGENRGEDILILYTYEQVGLEPGPIQRVELRTLELPE